MFGVGTRAGAAALIVLLAGTVGADVGPPPPPSPTDRGPVIPPEENPNYPRCKILSFSTEPDGSFILTIDKGSAHKLKVGMVGYILQGPDFTETLLHTEFHIVKILDANHSLARIPPGLLKQLNQKNNRAVISRK